MLHELVFLGCHSQFASYPYTSAWYSNSRKILQPYVAATARMHSDAILFSTGALLMKRVIKNNRQQQMVHFRFGRIRLPDTCEPALTGLKRCGSVPPVCRYVLTIISVHILHKCDETSLAATHMAVRLTLK